MTSDRIKEIQETTAYPQSVSVMLALNQVWNECEQEKVKNCSIPDISESTNSELGSYHWFHTIIARHKHIGEFLTEKTPDVDNLILYKGSFNLISISHQELMENSIKHYTGTKYKAVFCLSFNTFEKGKQSIDSFKNRIKYINKLGYCVLVNNNPFFKDLNQLIRYKFGGNLVFVAGADTMNRLVLDFIAHGGEYPDDIKEPKYQPFIYENHFKTYVYNKPVFLTFNRGNIEWHPDVMNIPRIKVINHKQQGVSSTDIRKALGDKDFDKVKTLVPIEIYDELIMDFIN